MPGPITVTPNDPIHEPFAEAFQRTLNRMCVEMEWHKPYSPEANAQIRGALERMQQRALDRQQRHGPRLSEDIQAWNRYPDVFTYQPHNWSLLTPEET